MGASSWRFVVGTLAVWVAVVVLSVQPLEAALIPREMGNIVHRKQSSFKVSVKPGSMSRSQRSSSAHFAFDGYGKVIHAHTRAEDSAAVQADQAGSAAVPNGGSSNVSADVASTNVVAARVAAIQAGQAGSAPALAGQAGSAPAPKSGLSTSSASNSAAATLAARGRALQEKSKEPPPAERPALNKMTLRLFKGAIADMFSVVDASKFQMVVLDESNISSTLIVACAITYALNTRKGGVFPEHASVTLERRNRNRQLLASIVKDNGISVMESLLGAVLARRVELSDSEYATARQTAEGLLVLGDETFQSFVNDMMAEVADQKRMLAEVPAEKHYGLVASKLQRSISLFRRKIITRAPAANEGGGRNRYRWSTDNVDSSGGKARTREHLSEQARRATKHVAELKWKSEHEAGSLHPDLHNIRENWQTWSNHHQQKLSEGT